MPGMNKETHATDILVHQTRLSNPTITKDDNLKVKETGVLSARGGSSLSVHRDGRGLRNSQRTFNRSFFRVAISKTERLK